MKRDLDALAGESFDVLILGGGVTGAGVALDAATRGWRVALIDKGDFASGTSSVSSKLVHGGLRYLEHGQIGLVHEALHERGWLLRAAPHLVQPLRFVLPYYQGARVAPWQWRLALTAYDVLAGAANIARSAPLSLRKIEREWPGLRRDGLCGGVAYYDAQMDDARLCLAVIQTAVAHGAVAANYVEAIAFEKPAGVIRSVIVRDLVAEREFPIRARQVLNATGPWVDAVCRLAGDSGDPHLAPTKGVHVILPDRPLPGALLLLHPEDGRVFFVIPWLGKTLVGTTDTLTLQGPDALTVLPEEIEYLLQGWRHHFPTDATPPVLGAFAGLRPIIQTKPGEPSARSREFRLFTSPSGLISVAGGKYTTFRAMAEQITGILAKRLGKRELSRTKRLLLQGAPTGSWISFQTASIAMLKHRFGLSEFTARRLVERYGTSIHDVTAYLNTAAARKAMVPGEPVLHGEVAYQRDHEMALFPEDHLLRRTRLGLVAAQRWQERAADAESADCNDWKADRFVG